MNLVARSSINRQIKKQCTVQERKNDGGSSIIIKGELNNRNVEKERDKRRELGWWGLAQLRMAPLGM